MDTIDRILTCAGRSWSPRIGDPNLMAWITVAAYAAAALASLAMARAGSDHRPARTERAFWLLWGIFLAFLAVNKQLDLQSLMTSVGRCAARLQGWYEIRRTVQAEVILGLVVFGAAAGLVTLWLLRGTLRRTLPALLGLVWITTFVLVRAVGFHHVDRLIGWQVGGMRLNWAFELGGIALFIMGVVWARLWRPGR